MTNQVVWFDIPVRDLDRAIQFYSAVLGREVKSEVFSEITIGVFPDADKSVSGCLVVSEGHEPSEQGPLIYLNASGRLDEALVATEVQGGAVLRPKHANGPFGFRAIIRDSEGNRLALHSE